MNELMEHRKQWRERLDQLLISALEIAGGRRKLADQLGFRYQTVSSWLRGAEPTEERQDQLEEFVSEEDLSIES